MAPFGIALALVLLIAGAAFIMGHISVIAVAVAALGLHLIPDLPVAFTLARVLVLIGAVAIPVIVIFGHTRQPRRPTLNKYAPA